MSKTYKVMNDIAKAVIVKPLLNQVRKEKKEDDKRYSKWLNEVDRMLDAEAKHENKRVLDVHQPYDSIIHENDFW